MLSKVCVFGPVLADKTCIDGNFSSNFTRTVWYRSIASGTASYEGLNVSSVNSCISWAPPTEIIQVTVRIMTGNDIGFATVSLQTTSLMKLMKPMTIVYDSTMTTARSNGLSGAQTIGIAVGVALVGLIILLSLMLLFIKCARNNRSPGQVEPKIENDPRSDESIGVLQQGVDWIEAPENALHEADEVAMTLQELHSNQISHPSQLHAGHQTSVELPASPYHTTERNKQSLGTV
jgi:hypothetical protein